MLTFVMLTRLSPDALRSPKTLAELEHAVVERIGKECPKVKWLHNFAILGGCDYLDIFQAPDMETAMKVSTVVRTFGHATTEVWAAEEWSRYKQMLRAMPKAA